MYIHATTLIVIVAILWEKSHEEFPYWESSLKMLSFSEYSGMLVEGWTVLWMNYCSGLKLLMERICLWDLSILLPIKPIQKKVYQQHFVEPAGEPMPRAGKSRASECILDYWKKAEYQGDL